MTNPPTLLFSPNNANDLATRIAASKVLTAQLEVALGVHLVQVRAALTRAQWSEFCKRLSITSGERARYMKGAGHV